MVIISPNYLWWYLGPWGRFKAHCFKHITLDHIRFRTTMSVKSPREIQTRRAPRSLNSRCLFGILLWNGFLWWGLLPAKRKMDWQTMVFHVGCNLLRVQFYSLYSWKKRTNHKTRTHMYIYIYVNMYTYIYICGRDLWGLFRSFACKHVRSCSFPFSSRLVVSICSFLLFPLNKTKLDYRQKQLVYKTRLNWIS